MSVSRQARTAVPWTQASGEVETRAHERRERERERRRLDSRTDPERMIFCHSTREGLKYKVVLLGA